MMWQKDLKLYKKNQPIKNNLEKETKSTTVEAPSSDISFSDYCQQFNIKKIDHDTVEIKKPKSANKAQTNNSYLLTSSSEDFSFMDTDNVAKEFFRHGQRNLPKELRQGKFFFNQVLDTHNLTRIHALNLVERIINDTSEGKCIKIIHGIGINSENNQPVLLGIIRKYLSLSSNVLAYSYGNPEQGGNGVTLVKLMR